MIPLKTELKSPSVVRLATLLLAVLTAVMVTGTAVAKIDPERIADDQTGWWYLSNVTEAQVTDMINTEDARLTDIEIYSTSPLRFTAAFVRNSGTFASGFWWYYGLTFADISFYLDANNARLIDIERYVIDGQVRYAVVMVPDTGNQDKTWWWYVGIPYADVVTHIADNNGRLIDIESYDTAEGRRYAVIMLENTGEDAAAWGWFANADLATVQAYMADNDMRILEFEIRNPATPTMDVILISKSYQTPQTWWYYYGLTFAEVGAKASQAGSRIVDIDRYDAGGGAFRYNIVMLNVSSSLTVGVGSILDWGENGDTGCYLREIGGPTYASLQPDFTFEPASSLKIAHHLHAMRQVQSGGANLLQQVNYSINYSGSCPLGGAPTTTQTLRETLRRMMVNSDNAATKGISDTWGLPAITLTAQTWGGMTESSVNHEIGCGSQAVIDPNVLTLRNATTLFERVETGLALNPAMRDTFYAIMQNQDTVSPWWFTPDLEGTVNDVASDLGIPEFADSYWAAVRTAWKPGGYTLDGKEYVSVSGIVSLPICFSWPRLEYRDFVFGVFVHGGVGDPETFNRVRAAAKALFPGVIASAMRSCPTSVPDDMLPSVAGNVLQGNYPNPFNPSTRIVFDLERPAPVDLRVYDAAGRLVTVLANERFAAGRHEAVWDGRDESGRNAPAGVYFAKLRSGDRIESRKMALIK